uniref:Uncharacterized protein n=1 Tax=Arundo donax TaxID=35708 RepID=A0A0A8ZXX5_ARUDO
MCYARRKEFRLKKIVITKKRGMRGLINRSYLPMMIVSFLTH